MQKATFWGNRGAGVHIPHCKVFIDMHNVCSN